MISEQKLDEWVGIYLAHIDEVTPEAHVRDEEGYKFKSVETFRQNFSIDAPGLAENLERAIEHTNLVAGNMYWPRKMLLIFAEEREAETREALRILFDESRDVAERIDEAEAIFDRLMEERNKTLGEEAHSFISLRFLSLLLGFRYPDEHDAIKPREWNMFCRFVDEDFRIPQGTSSGKRYLMLRERIEALRAKIARMPEVQHLKDRLTRGLEFSDAQFRWMAQDVIYVTARLLASARGGEKAQPGQPVLPAEAAADDASPEAAAGEEAMEFPLESYLENFLVKNWKNIDFGEPLSLYVDDEGTPAQQYPTSEGFIDLLAKDAAGNFVVIELKKGRSNQQVVGQILGYVGWVKRYLAEDGQKVRGIIVASDGNNALLHAVSTVSDFISVKYYRLKFSFENPPEE